MATVTLTSRRRVTFPKDVLGHLGVGAGDRIEVEKLPDGCVVLKAERPKGSIDDFIGCLAGKTDRVATLEEIEEAAANGWARESGR